MASLLLVALDNRRDRRSAALAAAFSSGLLSLRFGVVDDLSDRRVCLLVSANWLFGKMLGSKHLPAGKGEGNQRQ